MKLPDSILDTRTDTKKMLVSINFKFVPRNYQNKDGMSLLYLHVTRDGKRKRMSFGFYVPRKFWCRKSQRIKTSDPDLEQINLKIGHIASKISNIQTTYFLSNKYLGLEEFEEEFLRGIPRMNFFAFAEWFLEKQKKQLAKGTFRKQWYTIQKLKRFKNPIYFQEITPNFILSLRQYLAKLGNSKTTVESNLSTFKKFITAAEEFGILLPVKASEIKVGNTTGARTDLSGDEVKRLIEYFQSSFIKPEWKLILGYFLIACFTGLRISEIISIDRKQFDNDSLEYYEQKKDRVMRMNINQSTRMLLGYSDRLFLDKKSPIYMNRELKKIVKLCGITKKVTFHVGRHTFATNFLRAGGDPVSLQKLLGHSNIRQTMIYVHIVEQEANEKVFLIDKLFQ